MLARHEGQIVLVAGAIPGERVRVRIERVSKQVASPIPSRCSTRAMTGAPPPLTGRVAARSTRTSRTSGN